ncbi:hypothetical protein ACV3W4_07450 [Clostridium perfringens]|uniref:hypothetical protein n=1 Tax=Clostridium perfringens TaxID=1502 RepID=UPI001A360D46|nr:hypothetical protein [Clostridium perfringens]MCX0399170.1 hypothetical protein [Clostridium perfringens]MDJ8948941.1 hypothetical protein [Clostridium perfringens]HAT4182238.1 hypothetical protein [Clostridium perfringens]HAT4332199.1 hypothetical protein [Clostridium perfringens]
MNSYKYTLIVSQYYHSYHVFVVKFDEDKYFGQMRSLTKKLCEYKRGEDEWYKRKSLECGDPFYYEQEKEPHFRYNVNDAGDIYFLNFTTISYAVEAIKKYFDEERRAGQGYKKKSITEDIFKYHNKDIIREIIEKIYELA